MGLICFICQQPLDPEEAVPHKGEKVHPECPGQVAPAPDGGRVEEIDVPHLNKLSGYLEDSFREFWKMEGPEFVKGFKQAIYDVKQYEIEHSGGYNCDCEFGPTLPEPIGDTLGPGIWECTECGTHLKWHRNRGETA